MENFLEQHIARKFLFIIPAYAKELEIEKVEKMLKTLEGRMELRENIRDFISELEVVYESI